MRNVVHGLLVADHPDEHRQVRLSCFTHKTMQRLRTSRSIPSSLTFFFNSAFSRRSRASSSLSPTAPAPADLRARASQLPLQWRSLRYEGKVAGREPSCRCSAHTGEPNDTAAGGYGLTRSRLDRSESAGRRCDFATRRGQHYGTVLIDCETGQSSTCYPAATQRPWPAGCGNIPAPRSSAVTELVPMRTVLTPAPRTQSRSPNGSTSGRTWELSSSGA